MINYLEEFSKSPYQRCTPIPEMHAYDAWVRVIRLYANARLYEMYAYIRHMPISCTLMCGIDAQP